MHKFKIVKDNKKSLRERSIPVNLPLSKEDEETLKDMLEYLKLSQDEEYLKKHPEIRSGVGLAAPQIGLNKTMLAIYYVDDSNKEKKYMLVNPKIISESIKKCYLGSGEGCLSVDKPHEGFVYRPYKVTVKAFDLCVNKEVEYAFTGFGSIVVQHEIDHLKGVLFYDHIDKANPFKKIDAVEI